MTVSAETNKVTYDCDGEQTEFSFNFKVFKKADLKVVIADSDGNETVLTLTTDYTVSGNLSDGGKITTVDTWASGNTITITLDMDFDQPTDLIYGGSYSSEAIETMVDRAVKMIQQLVVASNRSLLLKISSELSGLELPDPESGKWLYSSDGETLQWASTADPDTLAVSAFVETLLDDATASAFLTTLGFSTFVKTLIDDEDAAAFLTTLGFSAFAKTLLDDEDATTFLTTLGLDTDLLTLSLPANTAISAFAKTILDDANAAAARTTLGCPTDPAAGTAGLRTLGTGAQQAAPGNFASGSAIIKAWISFNGSGTIAIRDSFNVASITDNDIGDYTITWDTDFADANYCATGMVGDESTSQRAAQVFICACTAGSLHIMTKRDTGSDIINFDFIRINVMAIGAQ